MPPTRPRKFGRGSCGILGTTCTSLPRTVPGSTRWSAGSPYCHNARSNEVRTTACVNWNPPSWSSSRCTTSSPNPLCGPRVPMPFSTALDGSLPVLWPHTAQTICKKSVTQETRTGYAHLLEGWQVNSIMTIQGSLPWNLIDGNINGSDSSGTGEFADRWNIVGNPANIKASLTGVPFFDFTTPQTSPQACIDHADLGQLQSFGCYIENGTILVPPNFGTFGNIGRNPFRGPRLDNLDFSVVKTTNLNERVSVQLRAEFFNFLNHPHFANPNTQGLVDPSDPTSFGFIFNTPDVAAANPVIGTGGPRNIQLGLKFRF